MARLLEVVEFKVKSGRWDVGTTGTVVEEFDDGVLIEIADDMGRMLDLVGLPHEAVSVVWTPGHERLTN